MHKKELLEEKSLRSGKTESRKAHSGPASSLSNQALLSSMGSGKAMPEEVQSKMEESLGADFSGVRLFESPIVSDNGAEAVASGNNIAFAPGRLDMSSRSGLGLLGHELSHVASQARGEVSGSGFVNDAALEHQADLDGDRAASAFDSVSGMTLTPMTAAPAVASSAGPMQAKKGDKKPEELAEIAAAQKNTAANGVPAAVPAPAPAPVPTPTPAPAPISAKPSPHDLFYKPWGESINNASTAAKNLFMHQMFLNNGGNITRRQRQSFDMSLDKMHDSEWSDGSYMEKVVRYLVKEKLKSQTLLADQLDITDVVKKTRNFDAYKASVDLLHNFIGMDDLSGKDDEKRARAQKKQDAVNAIEQELFQKNAEQYNMKDVQEGFDYSTLWKATRFKKFRELSPERVLNTSHVRDEDLEAERNEFMDKWSPNSNFEYSLPSDKERWMFTKRQVNLYKKMYENKKAKEAASQELKEANEARKKEARAFASMTQMKKMAADLSQDQLSEMIEYLQNYQSSQNG